MARGGAPGRPPRGRQLSRLWRELSVCWLLLRRCPSINNDAATSARPKMAVGVSGPDHTLEELLSPASAVGRPGLAAALVGRRCDAEKLRSGSSTSRHTAAAALIPRHVRDYGNPWALPALQA